MYLSTAKKKIAQEQRGILKEEVEDVDCTQRMIFGRILSLKVY